MRIFGLLVVVVVGISIGGAAAEAIEYRGRVITEGASPQAAACVDLVRKGIDLVEGLPAAYRALGQRIKDLRCDPLPNEARHSSVEDNTTGVYMMESKDEAKGHIAFRRDPAFQSAREIALSLVGNGVYARRHQDWISAKKQARSSPEARAKAERLEKIITKSDLNLTVKAECENMDAVYGTLKALGEDANKLSGLSKLMLRRGCE